MGPGVSRLLWPLSPLQMFSRSATLMGARPSRKPTSSVRSSPGCLRTRVKSQGPDLNRSVADLQSAAWPLRHLGKPCERHPLVWEPYLIKHIRLRYAIWDYVWVRHYTGESGVSTRGLNTSLPSCVHPGPIKLIFYQCPITGSLFRSGFKLRCFQLLSLIA